MVRTVVGHLSFIEHLSFIANFCLSFIANFCVRLHVPCVRVRVRNDVQEHVKKLAARKALARAQEAEAEAEAAAVGGGTGGEEVR